MTLGMTFCNVQALRILFQTLLSIWYNDISEIYKSL